MSRVQIQDLVLDYRFQFNNNKIAWNVETCYPHFTSLPHKFNL